MISVENVVRPSGLEPAGTARPDQHFMRDARHDMTVILDRTTAVGVLVEVSGDVDLCTAPVLASVLHRATAGPADRIDIDLGSVRFLSTAGLQPLLVVLRHHPNRVGIVAVSDTAYRLFAALGLGALLPPASRNTDRTDVAA
jgi:anti-anti-sigma factor